jgi:hypothetical protein
MTATRLPGHSCRSESHRSCPDLHTGRGRLLKQRQGQRGSHTAHRLQPSVSKGGRLSKNGADGGHLRVQQHVGDRHSTAMVRVSDGGVHASGHGDGMQKAFAVHKRHMASAVRKLGGQRAHLRYVPA